MENERREDERARVSIEARWEGLSGQHKARVADLSLGGCFIDTLGQSPWKYIDGWKIVTFLRKHL